MSSEFLRSLSSSQDGIVRRAKTQFGEIQQETSATLGSPVRRTLTSSINDLELEARENGVEKTIADVVSSKVDAVVRIQSSCLKFDWLHPYRHAGQSETSGSGFFYTPEGLIITNAHVVVNAQRVWISIPSMGERRYDAKVVGICFDRFVYYLSFIFLFVFETHRFCNSL